MTAEETGDDPFPGLSKAFASSVQKKLTEKFGKKAPQFDWDDWLRLKPYLAAYKREAEDVRGYLNKGEAQLLRDISKRAGALLVAIERAEDAGLGRPVACTLRMASKRDEDAGLGEPIDSEHERTLLDDFQNILRNLKKDFALDGEISPDFPDMSRANLFSNFKGWWERSTVAPAEIVEGWEEDTHPTPFMFVAHEVFNLPGMPPPTGASYKSLKDFRRADRDRFIDVEKLAEALKKSGRPE